jgi:hypothetical protein
MGEKGLGRKEDVDPEGIKWRIWHLPAIILCVKEKDANKEALEQVEKATEAEPDLLKSEDLKRKRVDSKKRITDDNTSQPRS